MSPYLVPILGSAIEAVPGYLPPRTEAEIIAARVASSRHWRRRRGALRLRAAILGRRKHRIAARRSDLSAPVAPTSPVGQAV